MNQTKRTGYGAYDALYPNGIVTVGIMKCLESAYSLQQKKKSSL